MGARTALGLERLYACPVVSQLATLLFLLRLQFLHVAHERLEQLASLRSKTNIKDEISIRLHLVLSNVIKSFRRLVIPFEDLRPEMS